MFAVRAKMCPPQMSCVSPAKEPDTNPWETGEEKTNIGAAVLSV